MPTTNHNYYRNPTIVPNQDTDLVASVNNYDLHFKNTKLIPETEIIEYLKDKFPIYLYKYNNPPAGITLPLVELSQCFDLEQFDKQLNAKKNKPKFTIKATLNGNTNVVPLANLLLFTTMSARSFGSAKTKEEIKNIVKTIPEVIKEQVNTDVSRDHKEISFNNTNYSEQFRNLATNTSFPSADLFYSLLVQLYVKNNMSINYDSINKVALLIMQPFQIEVREMIRDHLDKIYKPEELLFMNTIINNVYIDITPTKQTFTVHYATHLLPTKDNSYDVENICGLVDWIFEVNLLQNTYKLTLILKYDEDNFDKTTEEFDPTSNEFDKKPHSLTNKDMIAVGASSVYITAIPFVLGVLGGKKTNKTKRNKTNKFKRKKPNKFKRNKTKRQKTKPKIKSHYKI